MAEQRIPKIVLDLYDYRSKIYSQSKEPSDLPVFTDIRQRTEYIFRWLYDTHGYKVFIDTAVKLKKIEGLESDDFNTAKGLIAEIVLICSIEEFHFFNDCPILRTPYIENKSGVAGIKKASLVVRITLFNNPRLGDTSNIT